MPENKPKLMVIEDELDQSESIKNYFSRRGFQVFTAATGEDGLMLIKGNKPDLVFLDMKLAGKLNGKDVLRILREDDKKTKVVIITGDLLSEKEIQKITALGIIEFLNKPIDFQALERVIKKSLGTSIPEALCSKEIKPEENQEKYSLSRIRHDLCNVIGDIANKCELYVLDTEEGFNKDKSEEERLKEAIGILKSVVKSTERLNELVRKIQ